jgi:hypothetical protein
MSFEDGDGVNVGAVLGGAFVSLLLAAALIIGTLIARRPGHIHNGHVLLVIASSSSF